LVNRILIAQLKNINKYMNYGNLKRSN